MTKSLANKAACSIWYQLNAVVCFKTFALAYQNLYNVSLQVILLKWNKKQNKTGDNDHVSWARKTLRNVQL